MNQFKIKSHLYLRTGAYFWIIFSTEPTNNVAPKKIGAEFGGWRVAYVKQKTVAFLTCQVTGFPVPIFL